jgi:hypothetical protein
MFPGEITAMIGFMPASVARASLSEKRERVQSALTYVCLTCQ